MPGDSDVATARKQAKAAQRLDSDEEGDDGEAQQKEQSSSESSDLSDSSDSSSESEEDTGEAAESADEARAKKPRRLKKSAMVEDQAERSDDGGSYDEDDMDSEEEAEELERQKEFQVEEEVEEEPGAQAELDQAERAKEQDKEDDQELDDQLQEELSRLGPRNTDHPASPKQPAPNRLYNMPGWRNLEQEVIDLATREQAEMVEQYGGTVASKARDSDTEEYSEEEEEQLSSKEKRANALRDLRRKQAQKQAGEVPRRVQVEQEQGGQAQPLNLQAMYDTNRRKRRLAAGMAQQPNQGPDDLDPDGIVDEGTPLTQALEEMCHCKGECRPVDGLRIHSDSEECLSLKMICLWEHAAAQCDGIRATLGKADNLPTAIPIGPFIYCMPAEQPRSATKVMSISQAQYHKQQSAQTPLDIQDTLGAGSFYIPGCIWAKADLLEGKYGRPGCMLDFWEGLALDAQQFLAKQTSSPDAASSPEWQVKIGNNTLSVNPDRRAGPVLGFASREDDFSRKNCRIYILQKMLFHLQNACDKLKQVTGNRCEFVFHAKA